MIEIKDELFAAPIYDWNCVPFMENRRKWWLDWYRNDGGFCFVFISPKKRTYSFFASRGANGGKVTDAEIACANGETIARYWKSCGDSPKRLDAVLRLTPKHIIDRLFALLDAIG